MVKGMTTLPPKPLRSQVVLRRIENRKLRDERKKVHLLDDRSGCPFLGRIEALGDGACGLGVGDVVFFDSVMGRELVMEDDVWVIVDEADVLAILA